MGHLHGLRGDEEDLLAELKNNDVSLAELKSKDTSPRLVRREALGGKANGGSSASLAPDMESLGQKGLLRKEE